MENQEQRIDVYQGVLRDEDDEVAEVALVRATSLKEAESKIEDPRRRISLATREWLEMMLGPDRFKNFIWHALTLDLSECILCAPPDEYDAQGERETGG